MVDARDDDHLRNRIAGLDLLRASAIALVVVYHALPLFSVAPFFPALRWLNGGWLGVDLFFVLSGFLIGDILLRTGVRLGESRILLGFWIGRWGRTLPAYYLFLGFNVLLQRAFFNWPFGSWTGLGPYFVFTQNLTGRIPPFFFESWSLAVEEWFYIVAPIALWALVRVRVGFPAAFCGTLAVMLSTPVLLRELNPGAADTAHGVAQVVVYRFDAIGYGMVAAALLGRYPEFLNKWRRGILGVGLALSAGFYAYLCGANLESSWFSRVVLPSLIPLGFALMLPWAATRDSLGRGRFERWVTAISRQSYSLYLVNIPTSVLVFFLVSRRLPLGYRTVAFTVAIYLVACLLLSAGLWRWFEAPVMQARARFSVFREAAMARKRR